MKLSKTQEIIAKKIFSHKTYTAKQLGCQFKTLHALQSSNLFRNLGGWGKPETFGKEKSTIKWKIDFNSNIMINLLSLVQIEVTEQQMKKWSLYQLIIVQDWAARYYLNAADNHIKVPEKPDFL